MIWQSLEWTADSALVFLVVYIYPRQRCPGPAERAEPGNVLETTRLDFRDLRQQWMRTVTGVVGVSG